MNKDSHGKRQQGAGLLFYEQSPRSFASESPYFNYQFKKIVIPAKAGIQSFSKPTGCRIKACPVLDTGSGMTKELLNTGSAESLTLAP
jgi:hypothetical protein